MTQPPSRAISPLPEKARTNPPKYRLLIEQSGYGNSLRGAVKRGDDAVYGWTANLLPTDLTRFLASHYFYESTRRYFERFQQITEGAYPIVFRDADGRETLLAYTGNQPCTAGITFDIRGDEVHISRSYADGTPLPDNAFVHGQMLFDVAAGVVRPIADNDAWQSWEAIFEELDGAQDDFEDEDEWDDEEYADEDVYNSSPGNPELRDRKSVV